MSNAPLMPKATAVWLVENTALSFDQIAEFAKLHPLEVKAKGAATAGATQPIDFDAYAAFVKDYTLDKVSDLTGVERGFLQELAELYADPKRKVMSLWTMGFNQHVRGVWANQALYNLHLLTGRSPNPAIRRFH